MVGTDSIFGSFVRRTLANPHAVFAFYSSRGEERAITNGEILTGALAVRSRLADEGVPEGAVVSIVLEHSPWLYQAFIGCVLAGVVPSFLPPLTPKQDTRLFAEGMAVLFNRTRPQCVITSEKGRPSVPIGDWPIILTDSMPPAVSGELPGAIPTLPLKVPANATAFLQHTSGTTGHKKGVMLSHGGVLEQIHLYSQALDIEAGDVVASWLPLYHDMGLIASFILPVAIGCPIISLDALEWVMRPDMLLDAVERHRAAFVWLPNFAFHHISRSERGQKPRDLSSIKAIVNCSEPCRTATFDLFAEAYRAAGITPEKLKVCYAMAENVFAVTQTPTGMPARRGQGPSTRAWLSCGAPLPGAEIEIRDPVGSRLPDGAVGEVCIRTTCLYTGYYLLPELTAERMHEGWFHTHDLGCIEGGELFVVGRIDDLLIINGKNVLAHEIEDAVSAVPGIAPGRVIALGEFQESVGSQRLVILMEPDGLPEAESDAILAVRQLVFSLGGIPPAVVQFVPKGFLVKSTSGKLARAASYDKWRAKR